jgi:predicted ATP-dependent serine protease
MSEDPSRYVCPNCGAEMDGLKCKIRCARCGYFESCSDLEPAPPWSTPPRPTPSAKASRDDRS